MKVLSLFSGIGAFEKALDNLGVPYDLIAYCEIDKYASKSYAAIHGVDESLNLGDITKVDEKALPKDIDLITYGFPCQDISLAGKQKGLFNEDGTQTRSGLFFEALRIIEATQPRVAIAENVKNLTSKKFAEQFKIVLESLEAAGYANYYQVLNAKDFGVPQNRERVFIVSIRKDIDTGFFQFPVGFPLKLRLKDMLEAEVDEKFYLSNGEKEYMNRDSLGNYSNRWTYANHSDAEKSVCLTANIHRGVPYNVLIEMNKTSVKVREATKAGYAEAVEGDSVNLEQPNSKTRRGRVGHGVAQTLNTATSQVVVVEPQVLRQVRTEYGKEIRKAYESGETDEKWAAMKEWAPRTDGIANTLSTVQKDNYVVEPVQKFSKNKSINHDMVEPINTEKDGTARTIKSQYFKNGYANLTNDNTLGGKYACTGATDGLRIRKLTPKECFRLMGFDDSAFEKAEAVNSNTQLYKQAGNSIVVPVVQYILQELFDCGALQT